MISGCHAREISVVNSSRREFALSSAQIKEFCFLRSLNNYILHRSWEQNFEFRPGRGANSNARCECDHVMLTKQCGRVRKQHAVQVNNDTNMPRRRKRNIVTLSHIFLNAYHKGLDEKQAAFAGKDLKYRIRSSGFLFSMITIQIYFKN